MDSELQPPTLVLHQCPHCPSSETWVTFRSHSGAALVCPACMHTWFEDNIAKYPALSAVPFTGRGDIR